MLRLVNSSLVKNLKSFDKKSALSKFKPQRAFATEVAKTGDQTATIQAEFNQTPQATTELNGLYKYLVYKFSSHKYNSIDEIPDRLPAAQVNYAKDKGRAYATVILIGATIVGSLIVAVVGKRDQRKGIKYTDGILNQHAQYSQLHKEMIKQSHK